MRNASLIGYLRLMRPANLPTAAADIFAGAALAGFTLSDISIADHRMAFLCLTISSMLLYAGGVVLNDVADYNVDITERPERVLPKGIVTKKNAFIFGILLLILGNIFALIVSWISGGVAVVITICVLLYDFSAKQHNFAGPLMMGLCRGANLVLGMSIFSDVSAWPFAIIPIVYIAAVTLISRGEVHGDNKLHLVYSGVLYCIVMLFVIVLHTYRGTTSFLQVFAFLMVFLLSIYIPLIKAYRSNTPLNIKKAVISGVLSIVLLDACLAVSFASWIYGVITISLLLFSIVLKKLFAIT